jgi:hypothetical protein
MYAVRPVVVERRDAGLVKLGRTILSKRLERSDKLEGMYAVRPVLAERRDAGLVKLGRTILSKRFGAKRQELWIGIAED